ncbi:MAG: HAD hydrolase-like protein [Spirochaetaceae bacterium]|jgi:phosphoglycolate phosphatase-like HAD superfamily hydrolase|nr:HAD hydrolase-like protein [Spirochaetaceae bacterium]
MDYQDHKIDFTPSKEFFIGIDSDGCVFDSMEVKHNDCFCSAFVNHMGLQSISKIAREVWAFVNLYSRSRGINRFLALIEALDLLREREDVKERGVTIYELNGVREWIKREPKLGMITLEKELENNSDPDLLLAMEWSKEVNENVKKIVRGVGPFTYVPKTLEAIKKNADIMVVSQTPVKNIIDEWTEHNIVQYADFISGQEMGTKAMHLKIAAKGKYENTKILMLGDAPGDYLAAKENNLLFFPIIPGKEDQSWKELYTRGLKKFFDGDYQGSYEKNQYDLFMAALPERPNWK